MIQLNRLEGFYWVAKTGGYAKAARAFPYPITQPAVHQQVKKLEGEVGAPLFERVGKDRIVLTPAGKTLYEFVAPFYTRLEGVVRRVRSGEAEGEIRIESNAMIFRYILPPWLRKLARKHPGIAVELCEFQGFDCGALLRGESDLIVAFLPDIPDGVQTTRIGTIYPFLVYPASHRLADRKRVRLADFAGDTFVGHAKGSMMRQLQEDELGRSQAEPAHTITTDSVDTILGIVASGLGFSLVPSVLPEGPRLPGLVARSVGGKRNWWPIYAAWRESAADNPLLRAALALAPKATGA
jgi:DNA-binding transcriptional LysR family regulator